jgi:EAL domain-containing protein (putative c-di-GMP-specific phosphodiesterase class I)
MQLADVAGVADWSRLVPQVIGGGGIKSLFQPIVRLSDHRAEGFEALARPAGNLEVPSVEGMFKAAEEMGRGADLDWSCRRAALREVSDLPAQSLLFLNVQTTALLHPVHDVDQMLMLLRFSRWEPERVVIEITEREPLRHMRRMHAVLESYWAAGFRFALDDVGEGYSTLEAAVTVGPDYVKIAGPICRAAADDPQARRTIRHALRVADMVGARVIAEGIETAAQSEVLMDLGVTLGQGYLLGRPAPALVATTSAAIRHARSVLGGDMPLAGPAEFTRLGRWVV